MGGSLFFLTPSIPKNHSLDLERSQTSGSATTASAPNGRDMIEASRSGASNARLFGTSSPITTEKYVRQTTVTARAIPLAYTCNPGICASHPANGAEIAFSPTAPLKIPIEVIPTWIVDKKRDGERYSSSAFFAPELPSSERLCKRTFLDETSAISDMAKTPFNTVSKNSSSKSVRNALISFVRHHQETIW